MRRLIGGEWVLVFGVLAIFCCISYIVGVLETENSFYKVENLKLHEDLKSTISITNAYQKGK